MARACLAVTRRHPLASGCREVGGLRPASLPGAELTRMPGDPHVEMAAEPGDGRAPSGADRGPPGQGRDASGGAAPVQVLICDDHEVLRHGLRTVLTRAPDLVVVAEAAGAQEALTLAARFRPDVTVIGLGASGPVVRGLVRA